MAAAVARARELVGQLRSTVSSNPASAKDLLIKFKIALTEFPYQSSGTAPSAEEAAVAREGLEYGVILCTKLGDSKGFERNVQMLKPLYASSSEAPAAADARRQVLGLHLLHLLVDANLPQFHTEVELLSAEDKASPFVAFVTNLENCFAEGAYNKILSASQRLPSEYYGPLVARLATTAREDIADCAATSYKTLSLAAAQKLFMFDSREALLAFLRERRPDLAVAGDAIVFEAGEKAKASVDAMSLLGGALDYATDLERIV